MSHQNNCCFFDGDGKCLMKMLVQNLPLGFGLMTVKPKTYDLHNVNTKKQMFSDPLCHVEGSVVILEEIIPINSIKIYLYGL